MNGIIIAFAKRNNAERIRDIVRSHGFTVRGTTTSIAGVLSRLQNVPDGVIICGAMLSDGHYSDLVNSIPNTVPVLLIDKQAVEDPLLSQLHVLRSPFTASSLFEALNQMPFASASLKTSASQKKKIPSETDSLCIQQAKQILMSTLKMTEQEAHRYLQKKSMDHKRSKIETARLVIRTMGKI